jgi:hypothetical protein
VTLHRDWCLEDILPAPKFLSCWNIWSRTVI